MASTSTFKSTEDKIVEELRVMTPMRRLNLLRESTKHYNIAKQLSDLRLAIIADAKKSLKKHKVKFTMKVFCAKLIEEYENFNANLLPSSTKGDTEDKKNEEEFIEPCPPVDYKFKLAKLNLKTVNNELKREKLFKELRGQPPIYRLEMLQQSQLHYDAGKLDIALRSRILQDAQDTLGTENLTEEFEIFCRKLCNEYKLHVKGGPVGFNLPRVTSLLRNMQRQRYIICHNCQSDPFKGMFPIVNGAWKQKNRERIVYQLELMCPEMRLLMLREFINYYDFGKISPIKAMLVLTAQEMLQKENITSSMQKFCEKLMREYCILSVTYHAKSPIEDLELLAKEYRSTDEITEDHTQSLVDSVWMDLVVDGSNSIHDREIIINQLKAMASLNRLLMVEGFENYYEVAKVNIMLRSMIMYDAGQILGREDIENAMKNFCMDTIYNYNRYDRNVCVEQLCQDLSNLSDEELLKDILLNRYHMDFIKLNKYLVYRVVKTAVNREPYNGELCDYLDHHLKPDYNDKYIEKCLYSYKCN